MKIKQFNTNALTYCHLVKQQAAVIAITAWLIAGRARFLMHTVSVDGEG
jgi:hypothetical protein